MKGLLIKDFKLMKQQKTFFLMIVVLAIGMAVFSYDTSFTLGFLTFAMSLFTLSTISYDEFDNGNAFLFCLPITRTSYVIGKYYLGLILGCSSLLFATILVLTANIIKGALPPMSILTMALVILPFILIVQAIMIPFQLKFGGDKGRIAIIGGVGVIVVTGLIVVKILEAMGIDIGEVIDNLPTLSMGMLIGIIVAIAVILLLVSVKISISIMNKKEF